MKDIQTGNHYIDDNTILIQIQDWDTVEFSHIKFKKISKLSIAFDLMILILVAMLSQKIN